MALISAIYRVSDLVGFAHVSVMKSKGLTIKHLCLLILLVVGAFCSRAEAAYVVSHPAVETKQLTTAQLRRIYTMRQTTWPDGQGIVVYTLPSSHPTHQEFTKTELKIFPYQLDKMWIKLTFSGLAQPPVKVNSMEELIEAVKSTPGAIGYVDKSSPLDGLNVIAKEAK